MKSSTFRAIMSTPWMTCLTLASILAGSGARSQAIGAVPARTDALVSAAVTRANAESKVVLIEFGASWCTWCRSFEAFVRAPAVAPIIANNFVLVNLTVKESDDKKALENPGGQDAMNNWGGGTTGLPFYVFLNAAGKKIADSNAMPDGSNIGFPATPQEIEIFVGLLDKTAPRLTPRERAKIIAYLTQGLKR